VAIEIRLIFFQKTKVNSKIEKTLTSLIEAAFHTRVLLFLQMIFFSQPSLFEAKWRVLSSLLNKTWRL